ncbi:MAG TPA: hypothetical protein VNY24_13555 [Candidatus Acidoferrales bacterium]|jgi:hypothetical protein|nr:hypothetical protein [Candidatus Acidoferrales bacterium]
MHRFGVIFLCSVCVFGGAARGQNTNIEPIHAQLGAVLTFHLQTRLNPADRNEMDVLPKGTVIRVRMLNGVDSNVDRDGSEFHGEVVDSVSAGSKVIVHSESEVRGILVLLRSKNHPDGFRYELLVTSVTDHAKTYDLTASLNPSFFDAVAPVPPTSKAEAPRDPNARDSGAANLQSPLHN